MATYKEIHGVKVQSLDSDPTALAGDVWYNKSTSKLKMYTYAAGSWATGGALNQARNAPGGGAGTQTAGLVFGGGDPDYGQTEEYDGSSWAEQSDLNTARREVAGLGLQTAGIAVAGINGTTKQAVCESYDGSSWTEVGDANTARRYTTGCGISTSGLLIGGNSGSITGIVESWNGTSWTETGDLNTARLSLAAAGDVSTSAIAFGGGNPTKDETESFDGSSWTEVGDLNSARSELGGAGVATAALAAGSATLTESFDGSSWTAENTLANSHTANMTSGTSLAAFCCGRNASPYALNEEWTSAIAAQTVAFD